MFKAAVTHSTSRRGLLAGIAALSGVGLAPAPLLAASDVGGPDAELIDLCKLFHRQCDGLERMAPNDQVQADALNDERWTNAWLIEQTCPETARGHRMKAGVAAVLLAECQGDEPDGFDISLALTALSELADAPWPSA